MPRVKNPRIILTCVTAKYTDIFLLCILIDWRALHFKGKYTLHLLRSSSLFYIVSKLYYVVKSSYNKIFQFLQYLVRIFLCECTTRSKSLFCLQQVPDLQIFIMKISVTSCFTLKFQREFVPCIKNGHTYAYFLKLFVFSSIQNVGI